MTTTAGKILLLMDAQSYAQKAASIFGSNLIAYLKLVETAGTAAADSTPTGATGTYGANVTLANAAGPGPSMGFAPAFPGSGAGGVTFDATPLTALNGAWSTEELTISAWLKMDTVAHWNSASAFVVFAIGANGSNKYQLYKSGANKFSWQSNRGGSTTQRDRTSTSELTWVHIALVASKSSNFFRGYWAGAQVGADQALAGNWSGSLAADTTSIGLIAGVALWFGNISNIAIAKVAATPTQIAELAVAQ